MRQLYLLPRFHLSVRGVLEARPPEVVELSQPLPRSMLLIQEAIVAVTQALLKDLKSSRQARYEACATAATRLARGAEAQRRALTEWFSQRVGQWEERARFTVSGSLFPRPCPSLQVDTSDLTMEDGLFKSFDILLQKQLGPIWCVHGAVL